MTPRETWEQAKMVGWILQRLDPERFRDIDWATLHDEVEAYYKMQEAA